MTPERESTPLNPQQPGCSAMVRINRGQWSSCLGEPTFAAAWTVPHTRERWRVMLCEREDHRNAVPGARPLTEADREALAIRRRRWQDALDGKGWIPPKPLP